MKHELSRQFYDLNTVLCAGLNGGWVRQNMRGAKAAIAQTLEFVSSVVAARVSSMWGFGGNWREGLHITIGYMTESRKITATRGFLKEN